MSPVLTSLGIDQMSVDERMKLIDEIWASIAESSDVVALSNAQKQDLQRRLAPFKVDPKVESTWEEVQARVWGKT